VTSAALAGLVLRQPFRIAMFGDDDGVFVERPGQVKHEPGNRIVVVTRSDGGEAIIDLDRVAMIVVSPPKKGGGK
jgi:hypothetical protein